MSAPLNPAILFCDGADARTTVACMKFSLWVAGSRREVTSWVAGADKPARAGVYQRSFPAGPYSRWDAVQWCQDAAGVATAAGQIEPSAYQKASWRGLVESPRPQESSDSTSGSATSHVCVPFDDAS